MAIKPYHYEPLTDFSVPENRKAMEEALREVRSQFGLSYPLVIGADRIDTEKKIVSVNPSNPQQVIGSVSKADTSHIDMALETGWKAFAQWKKVPGPMRARYLYKAAAIMRRRKLFLSALEVYEAGKTWTEAEADVAEAIDFLEYYGRQMERLSEPVPLIPLDDEEDRAFYVPLGVGAIIPPWNFPLAILTGMTSAAIVTGNCVILKPASATPIIGAHFAEIMREAGLPPGVLNFVPGDGGTIGDYIVTHPLTRFISFTGSREVGLRINQLAAQVSPGQKWIKRVVAEMGGKDAIVVDETADLDAAAEGIVTSAFGFQGQKCSACSRAIIVDDVYDLLLSKIVERTKKLRVGPADNLNNHMGPVIDEKAYDKIFGYIQWGKENAKLQTGGTTLDGEGYFIPPTIFSDVAPGSKLEQEEVFGPVLAVIRAKDWADALKIANDTEYGLTGSVYTARRERIEQAADEFEVGNLYINRKCTGAIVGAHPFGGFNMSGTDSKTGSPDYLLLFMQMKVVAERF
ncbi:L-glutamate gamma-semialdehyde dehydrogenase [Sulfobacillus thermosulfidooxidans]|uniref:L-glutamate gamma-semialdehyde dehydrogenase n=1 Tax=Sulfobacillus thermosulfidooxidans TaxID=28034 RepID=UPI00096BB009|nr:L-glutamate gamma-semialdehyde dehydrogenase [Sulfobacillus thermosulfidooxidans]OLZ11106.1 L-glutamate gamma-semialdehyde dehydrogenase [Sulfobacillus thermosulfidooxidans]OLZ14089.1 L-glutamate gamma-semialdehyde dehydrogenase [Sulfobacillus thermosulfidooxidans]OLZ18833.1 L-glutamate gamma-semialdehyde dehydrogenase [Sulfobacillus thermosulfidooxidans]